MMAEPGHPEAEGFRDPGFRLGFLDVPLPPVRVGGLESVFELCLMDGYVIPLSAGEGKGTMGDRKPFGCQVMPVIVSRDKNRATA